MENNTSALIPTGVWLSYTNSKLDEVFLLTINFSCVDHICLMASTISKACRMSYSVNKPDMNANKIIFPFDRLDLAGGISLCHLKLYCTHFRLHKLTLVVTYL